MRTKILSIILLFITITCYSQDYRYGLITDITTIQGNICIIIDRVDVSYVNERLVIVNNNRKVESFILHKTVNIQDCLYNRIHYSNILSYKQQLVRDRQFVLFTYNRSNQITNININCYN